MSEVDQAIRGAAQRFEPPQDWLDHIREGARRRRRNQRILATVVGIAVPVAVLVPLLRTSTTSERTPAVGGCAIPVGVTGWWRWDGSGADAIGGRGADLHGNAAFAPGLVGDALTLDGDGDFADVPDDPALDVGNRDFTMSMWVRFASTEGEQVLVEDFVETRDERTTLGWTLTKLANDSIGFGLGRAGGADARPLDLPTGSWVHVVARRLAGAAAIFVDGEKVASAALRDPQAPSDSASALRFGHRGGPQDTPGSNDTRGFFLDGQIDEVVLVVGRGLSGEEIRDLYEARATCRA